MMELDNDDDLVSLTDDLGISILACTSRYLQGEHNAPQNQCQLCAMVDSESTHTFIHDVVMHCLGA
jgi:hypothetical protein